MNPSCPHADRHRSGLDNNGGIKPSPREGMLLYPGYDSAVPQNRNWNTTVTCSGVAFKCEIDQEKLANKADIFKDRFPNYPGETPLHWMYPEAAGNHALWRERFSPERKDFPGSLIAAGYTRDFNQDKHAYPFYAPYFQINEALGTPWRQRNHMIGWWFSPFFDWFSFDRRFSSGGYPCLWYGPSFWTDPLLYHSYDLGPTDIFTDHPIYIPQIHVKEHGLSYPVQPGTWNGCEPIRLEKLWNSIHQGTSDAYNEQDYYFPEFPDIINVYPVS